MKAKVGIAGIDEPKRVQQASIGTGLKHRDKKLSKISPTSQRLADVAARTAWSRGVWFASFEYLAKRVKGQQPVAARGAATAVGHSLTVFLVLIKKGGGYIVFGGGCKVFVVEPFEHFF